MSSSRNIKIGNEFLKVAEDIAKCYKEDVLECSIAKSEGLIRSGVSRAYYAAFLIARYAIGLEYLMSSEVHKRVIDTLKESGYANIADKLVDLRRKRNTADYDTYVSLGIGVLTWATQVARNVIEELLKLIPSLTNLKK